MKIIFALIALTLAANAQAKDDGSSLQDIHALVGSGKFIEIERLYQGEGKYDVVVNTSIPDKKTREVGGLVVKGKKDGDYFSAIEELCNPTTVMNTGTKSELSFHCFTK